MAGVQCPFLPLADGGASLLLPAGVFDLAFLAVCASFPLLAAVPFLPLPGGGTFLGLAGVGGTLVGLTDASLEPLTAAEATADVDWMAEVLGWVLDTLARGGVADTVAEDTGAVCTYVGVVTASEGCVLIGVLVIEVVDEDVVHTGVSGDATGREVDDEKEGHTVEAVDVGVSAWRWCLCECL
ncbi:hypothetical protein NDU88_004585 [Pleurodeles waltl]|uniref:Uncharacterized protein n=1 Tax=Pleurodeles waltl TaxID=8319 RepID=A0AAV7MXX8_PLEWA|nr:hypothetical protein NDU88_004585 [Pleurodeles waltl]